ncbi:MAG: chemotaxis protein CheY [Candidatus Syntrophoarchaeum butanivorans]|uniref:Chemotaxis protein CheY n=2 Tax=Candidatus Syntropharchaeum butanivorans TaxID=1839936 RepID=A0A1F2P6A6_9EURY|nr:MAG: chemotaxis protein CheY [Candidatus Syntrophoarchaeum butanivorans]
MERIWMEKKRILIVDDAEAITTMMKEMIDESRYEVFIESTGERALDAYRELRPDLVTMDIVMPNMNGVEAIKSIREFDPNAKIVVITAIDMPNIINEAMEAGAVDYLVKPFVPKRLERIFKKHLG